METLKRYEIDEADIAQWEKALGLNIPKNEYGRKQYSPHHVNLFKNIKKHLTLGRTLDEIRQLIKLPPIEDSHPKQAAQKPGALAPGGNRIARKNNQYASVPRKPEPKRAGAAEVVKLVQNLTQEKDYLYRKLVETEKLNSHLYSANTLYHKKVRDLNETIRNLKSQLGEDENFKLKEQKSQLATKLIHAEKELSTYQTMIQQLEQEKTGLVQTYENNMRELEQRIDTLTQPFSPQRFRGHWMETGELIEVEYDNFGINIENERARLFRITEPPERIFGNSAVIHTSYQYETNKLWRRNETLLVTVVDNDTLEGELISEYVLDGVPVAKAVYRVVCRRQS